MNKPFLALFWKEWREQIWRLYLSSFILGGLLGSLFKAKISSPYESAFLIFIPGSLLMGLFFAAGTIAPEKTGKTWDFLIAQPISGSLILRVKWLVGLIQIIGTLWATLLFALVLNFPMQDSFVSAVVFICLFSCFLCISCFNLLFIILSKSRNETVAVFYGMIFYAALFVWNSYAPVKNYDGVKFETFESWTTLFNPMTWITVIPACLEYNPLTLIEFQSLSSWLLLTAFPVWMIIPLVWIQQYHHRSLQ